MTEELELDIPVIITNDIEAESFNKPLYKKWFKAGGNAGFLSITPFLKDNKFVGKYIIDIGKIDPNSNKISSSTNCFIDGVNLQVYLDSVANGTAKQLFWKRQGTYSPESFIAYGGSAGANPIARVFKVEYWGAKSDTEGDSKGFAWKSGHFKGIVGPTGAITPDMKQAISQDMIKVSRLEMAEIATRVRLANIGFASNDPQWYDNDR